MKRFLKILLITFSAILLLIGSAFLWLNTNSGMKLEFYAEHRQHIYKSLNWALFNGNMVLNIGIGYPF